MAGELAEGGRYKSRRAIVLEAIIAIADADSEDDVAYHRAWCRLWEAMRAAGWAPKDRDLAPVD
jgi:hypothetical protein